VRITPTFTLDRPEAQQDIKRYGKQFPNYRLKEPRLIIAK
jgi:hypothetical protein